MSQSSNDAQAQARADAKARAEQLIERNHQRAEEQKKKKSEADEVDRIKREKAAEEQRLKQSSLFNKDVYEILSNGIVLQDNLRCSILTITFNQANVQQTIRHGLAFVPQYYVPLNKSVAMDIYNGDTGFDKTNIYLKSTVVGTVTLLVM